MNRSWFVAATLAAFLLAPAAHAQTKKKAPAKAVASKPMALTTEAQKASYTIGADLGRNLAQNGITVQIDALVAGLRDAQAGGKLALTNDEMKACMETLQKSVQAKQSTQNNAVADKNTAEGQAFLKENGAKPGVVTLPSGMQYLVLTQGSGPKPLPTDTVTTHYHGTLIDGTVFDSSKERGTPASFPVNGVIQGWQEALPMMNTGSTYRLFIPSELAYGNRGAGAKIGPNATLIFEVELISIKGK
jgi:FKBP-type peptidyl-prolyl cis-trans isomerase FklB